MEIRLCLAALILAVALALSAQTCHSMPLLMFSVPPVKFILCPDVNSDGHVDFNDVIAVSRSFGAVSGSHLWNREADISGDGKIDILDVALAASASCNID